MMNHNLLDSLQAYEKAIGTTENIFKGDLLSPTERDFLLNDPNAFLFGQIADQSVRAETAWSLPYKLSQRLGHFSMESIISDYTIEDMQNVLKDKPSLHR